MDTPTLRFSGPQTRGLPGQGLCNWTVVRAQAHVLEALVAGKQLGHGCRHSQRVGAPVKCIFSPILVPILPLALWVDRPVTLEASEDGGQRAIHSPGAYDAAAAAGGDNQRARHWAPPHSASFHPQNSPRGKGPRVDEET